MHRDGSAALRAGLAAFQGEDLKLRAMALTYISIFSLLPPVMVTVSMVRSFPDLDRVRIEIQDFLTSNLAVGARDKVQAYLDQYVFGASAMTPGLLGFALLLASAVVAPRPGRARGERDLVGSPSPAAPAALGHLLGGADHRAARHGRVDRHRSRRPRAGWAGPGSSDRWRASG